MDKNMEDDMNFTRDPYYWQQPVGILDWDLG